MIFIKISGGLLDYFDKNIKSFKCTLRELIKINFYPLMGYISFFVVQLNSNLMLIKLKYVSVLIDNEKFYLIL